MKFVMNELENFFGVRFDLISDRTIRSFLNSELYTWVIASQHLGVSFHS